MQAIATMNDIVPGRADAAANRVAPHPQGRLSLFLGTWRTTGRQYDCPFGGAGSIVALETYQWLSGERFMIHRLDGRIDDDPLACVEVIANDAARSMCLVHSYYDDGHSNDWQLFERDGTWHLEGHWQQAGKLIAVRCTIWFQNGGNTRAAKWEYSDDGESFQPFWEVTSSKIT